MRVTIQGLALALLLSPLAAAQDGQPETGRRSPRVDRYEALMQVLQDLQAEVKQLREEVRQLRAEVRSRPGGAPPADVREARQRPQDAAQLPTDADIEGQMKKVATDEARLEAATKQLVQEAATQEKAEQQIKTLREALEGDDREFVFNGRTYTRAQVQQDLQARFERFKARQDALHKAKATLHAFEKQIQDDRKQLEHMLKIKRDHEIRTGVRKPDELQSPDLQRDIEKTFPKEKRKKIEELLKKQR